MQATAVQSAASLLGTHSLRGRCLSPLAAASRPSAGNLRATAGQPGQQVISFCTNPQGSQPRSTNFDSSSLSPSQWRVALRSNCSRRQGGRRVSPQRPLRTLAAPRPIVANWGQEVSWEDVEVAGVEKEAQLLYSISLNIKLNDKLQSGYTKAGQYVQVKIGDSKPAFLAIASPPQLAKEGKLEFLVKAVEGSTAELLTKVQPGQFVQVSQVMGKGFNVDAISPPESCASVILFATGSGISPIRALIEAGFDASLRRDVRLFFGVRDIPYIPYQDRFREWEESGVQVNLVLSQPSLAWQGEAGFVQDAFKRSNILIEGPSTGAVLCGHKAMAQDVTQILKDQGVVPERILLNF